MNDLAERVKELAGIAPNETPVVSVYLDTHWKDEQQRERTRVFLKNELAKARDSAGGARLAADLDWIRREAETLIGRQHTPDVLGVALFGGGSRGLREILPVAAPFENAFVVADTPFLRPLLGLAGESLSAMVVFVDAKRARLIPVTPQGAGEEITLEHEVAGHHRQGGWSLLAQSRYQRRMAEQRSQHLEAVAEYLESAMAGSPAGRVVLAGEVRAVARFHDLLEPGLRARVAGEVSGTWYESGSELVQRAMDVLQASRQREARASVDTTLTEAAKGGRAAAGLSSVLQALSRGAVQRLYLLETFREYGRACATCGGLHAGDEPACRFCGKATRPVELGERIAERVIGDGGTVEPLPEHAGLADAGGIAAALRYAL